MEKNEPQKPKPTTQGKQTASHSSATRSKVKRTSLCDDDSSGSEAQEPPLKRQTRSGAKQADESAGINNNDKTPNSNAIDTNTVDGNTPAQTALQNDLVLETLLKYLNRSDILSCRLLNKQWQYEATKKLQRQNLVIAFFFRRHGSQKSRDIAFQDVCRRLSECTTSSLLSSFKVKTAALNDLVAAGATSFFTTVGNQLKHLTLHLDYTRRRYSFESGSLATDLQNLLFRQAPNLEFLEITFDFLSRWEDELEELDVFGQNQNGNNESLQLPKLKTFIVNGSAPAKFFEGVINAAVNLRSLGGDVSACMKYLMGAEGRTKIHLLKSWNLSESVGFLVKWDYFGVELVETFLTEHKQNLKLKIFEGLPELFFPIEVPAITRTVGLMNQILKSSAGSLQKLIIELANWLKVPLIIPHLPKLKEIGFHCCWSNHVYGGSSFFPVGFSWNNNFPNVSSIVLLNCPARLFRQFVSRMEIELKEPVPSIRFITINDTLKRSSIVPPLVTDFRHVFPNLVSISYVANQNYYKI